MTGGSLKVSMRAIASTIDKFAGAFCADGDSLAHELFIGAYSTKYGVSKQRVMHLIDEGHLSATTIEGIWVVEDKPPPAAHTGAD